MEMTKRNIIITIVSIVVIFAGLFAVYALTNKPDTSTTTEVSETKTLTPDDHIKWAKDKKAILTEYGDIQCPACRNFHDILRGMESSDKDITSKVTFVFRHYPLQQVHKNALNAAFVAEAAGRQGKFFEAVDTLYDSQPTWGDKDNPDLTEYLKDLKLDMNKLKADAKSKSVQNTVSNNIASGNRAGVDATPTFFLNGKKMEISSIDDFKRQLRSAISGK